MVERKAKLPWMGLLVMLLLVQCGAATGQASLPGVTISIAVISGPEIGGPVERRARSWESRNGAKVQIHKIPFDSLYARQLASLTASRGEFDVIVYAPGWLADFAPYLRGLPGYMVDRDEFDDVHPVFRERLMSWGGKRLAWPIDGDLFNGYYRRDLFADQRNRHDFRARYGHDLAPPETWDEYRDIAEFFTGRQDGEGRTLFGTVEAFRRGGMQYWTLFSRAAAYTNHPGFRGAQFFDPDTMGAEIDNPGWTTAVRQYLEILAFCPPDALDYSIHDARLAFAAGRTAMTLDWGDTAKLANDRASSAIAGKVGYFALPGTRRVWDAKHWQWEEFDDVYKVPFLAFGGWVASVPLNSEQPRAAWDYILWLSNSDNSAQDVVAPGSGMDPYRLSHFAAIDAWNEALSDESAADYLRMLQSSLNAENLTADLRVPGLSRYTDALEQGLTTILHRQVDVLQGLKQTAEQWEEITEQLGRPQQLAAYRSGLGLAPPAPHAAEPAQPGRVFTLGFSQATTTEPWRLLFNKHIRAEAARHPQVQLLIRDGEDDVAKQEADVRAFIDMPVDALLISPKETEALTAVVNAAFNAGIPVFVLDRGVASRRYTQFIGGDNRLIGRVAGEYIVELLGGEGRAHGKVLELWGGLASTPAQERHQGFIDVIGNQPGIELLVGPLDGDWKQDLAYELMVDAIETFPQIDLVYAHNDPMAYGAFTAAQEAGRANEIRFVGIDGIPEEGVKWVAQGALTATFLYQTPGEEAIRQASDYLSGKPIPFRVTLPTRTIDRSNVDSVMRESGVD